MNIEVIGISLYILAQLLIGVWVSRRINNEEDYLLAGRSLGLGLATLSVFATWFGAETCIGAAGAVYDNGLTGATIDPFGYASSLVVMGLVFSIALWRLKLTTLADLFRTRFSPKVEMLAVLLMVPGSILWAAAQIRAFGQVLSVSSGYDMEIMIAAAALVVIIYTMYGGLMADVVTDAIQDVALMIGLALLLYFVLDANGNVNQPNNPITPESLTPSNNNEYNILEMIELWAIPICGSVVSQDLISRVLATRSPQIARQACVFGGLLYLLVGLMPVSLGLVGAELIPGLSHGEQVLPALAKQYFSTFLYIIFAGALISAILSTVDSALLAASALLSHNLIVPRLKEEKK